ncbi:MAG: methyltransferase type 12 [Acidimicrobiia bacterium]|nr:MAG: methyltransferase type 12 [Acidimicrobiia bacterium]
MSVDAHLALTGGERRDASAWVGEADEVDRRVLDRILGPVLDIGCGPGRHVVELARRGIVVLGIDVGAPVLSIARRRGAVTLERSVFDRVPGSGRWRSALLLDGNVGIGGDPGALLARTRRLLAPGGTAIVEVAAPGASAPTRAARLVVAGRPGPWFTLATLTADEIAPVASAGGFLVGEEWHDGGRWFARLEAV